MNRRPALVGLAIGALLVGGPTTAQQGAPGPDRRAAIAAERAAIDRRHLEQERACRQRFVVTECLNQARDERRAALVPLRQEELRIDTEERKQRAAARLGEIEEKQRVEAARDAASAPQGVRESPPTGHEPPRPASRIGGGPPKPVLGAEERARRETASLARYERQQQEAESHRAAVSARNAERAAKGKVARPLPPVPGASAP